MNPGNKNTDELMKDLSLTDIYELIIMIRAKKMGLTDYTNKIISPFEKNSKLTPERLIKEFALRN